MRLAWVPSLWRAFPEGDRERSAILRDAKAVAMGDPSRRPLALPAGSELFTVDEEGVIQASSNGAGNSVDLANSSPESPTVLNFRKPFRIPLDGNETRTYLLGLQNTMNMPAVGIGKDAEGRCWLFGWKYDIQGPRAASRFELEFPKVFSGLTDVEILMSPVYTRHSADMLMVKWGVDAVVLRPHDSHQGIDLTMSREGLGYVLDSDEHIDHEESISWAGLKEEAVQRFDALKASMNAAAFSQLASEWRQPENPRTIGYVVNDPQEIDEIRRSHADAGDLPDSLDAYRWTQDEEGSIFDDGISYWTIGWPSTSYGVERYLFHTTLGALRKTGEVRHGSSGQVLVIHRTSVTALPGDRTAPLAGRMIEGSYRPVFQTNFPWYEAPAYRWRDLNGQVHEPEKQTQSPADTAIGDASRPAHFHIHGVPVRLHKSLFLGIPVLLLSAFGSAALYMGQYGLAHPWITLAVSVIGAIGFYVSIFAHELGHLEAAHRFKLKMSGMTLHAMGGGVDIESIITVSPKVEFIVSAGGPAVTGLLAVLFGLLAQAGHFSPMMAVAAFLWRMNKAIFILNMMPIFPLDGGRVLRSLLRGWLNWDQGATRLATITGIGLVAYTLVETALNIYRFGLMGLLHSNLLGITPDMTLFMLFLGIAVFKSPVMEGSEMQESVPAFLKRLPGQISQRTRFFLRLSTAS